MYCHEIKAFDKYSRKVVLTQLFFQTITNRTLCMMFKINERLCCGRLLPRHLQSIIVSTTESSSLSASTMTGWTDLCGHEKHCGFPIQALQYNEVP